MNTLSGAQPAPRRWRLSSVCERTRLNRASSLLAICMTYTLGCAPPEGVESPPPSVTESSAKGGTKSAEPTPKKTPSPSPEGEEAPRSLETLTRWSAAHAFVSSTMRAGVALGEGEALALSGENLIALTHDGGDSWYFSPDVQSPVTALAGVAGGPYLAVGERGSVNLSQDGRRWDALPRYTGDNLIAISVTPKRALALGEKGTVLRIDLPQREQFITHMPEGFQAKALATQGERFFAFGQGVTLESTDAITWSPTSSRLKAPQSQRFATSQGLCALGRVVARRGVVCTLSGPAHHVSGVLFVEGPSTLARSLDGGETWRHAPLPFSNISRVFGSAGGPYFAVGKDATIASSPDGASWTLRDLPGERGYRDGLVDGERVLIVGEMGRIARSNDSGASWSAVPSDFGATFKRIIRDDDHYLAIGEDLVLRSTNGGAHWEEDEASPLSVKALNATRRPTCDADGVTKGHLSCVYSRERRSPSGLAHVHSVHFQGDTGVAWGESGLLMVSVDGGKTWRARQGLGLGRIERFEAKGDLVVALNRSSLAASRDGGKSFSLAKLPSPMIGGLEDLHITDAGAVYVCGKKGYILKGEGDLDTWLPLNTGERNTRHFRRLFGVGENLYAASARGELMRSPNEGASWRPIALGVSGEVIAMSGEGSVVVALMRGPKEEGWLLRSDDRGAHFAIERALGSLSPIEQSARAPFEWRRGVLHWGSKSSRDGGRSWTLHPERAPAERRLSATLRGAISGFHLTLRRVKGEPDVQLTLPFEAEEIACTTRGVCWASATSNLFRAPFSM